MKKVILFSPTGYVGGYVKERIQLEKDIQWYGMVRGSDLKDYKEDYDIMIYSASVSYADVKQYVQDNVMTALSIVQFCKEHHVKRIIYLSSDSIYGELNAELVTEKAVMVNPSVYGVTKYLAEKIIIESGIPYYILRLPGVVGRVWRKNFIYNLMSALKRNENIELYNMERKFNNILDVDDLIDFIILLCNNEGEEDKSEILLLGNVETMVLKDVVSYITSLYHSSSIIKNYDTNEKRYFIIDVTKAVEYGYTSKKIKTIIKELYQIKDGGMT